MTKEALHRPWRLWGATALAATLVLGACQSAPPASSSPTGGAAAPSATPKDLGSSTMALDFQFYGHHAPWALAVKNGLYKKRGVAMTVTPGRSSGATITAVQAGQIDFGYASPSVLASTLVQDPSTDVVVVATIMQHAPWVAAFIKGRNINEAKDLAGKKWGVNPGAPMDAFYRAYMASRKYELGVLAGVESQQLLFASQLDVLPIPITIYPQLEANAKTAGLTSGYFALNEAKELDHVNWSLITKRSFAQQKPELVKAVVAATLEGWLQTFKEPGAAIDAYVSEFEPLANKAIARALVDVSLPLAVSPAVCKNGLGYGDAATWDQTIAVFRDFLKITPAPDPKRMFTNEYLPTPGLIPPTC
jgi:NitT/TauT family transport system substrate-binding protein